MNEENGEEVILNTPEADVDLDTASEETEEEQFDWKAEALKAKELADNYKIRAEKAERKAKETPEKKEPKHESTASTEDLYALMSAQVPQEDIADVKEYAQFKGISIAEALKTSAVRSILAEKQELRTTALATNTGGAKRSSGKVSDDTLLANANKGILPESEADMDRLVALKTLKHK